ncbi:MAG: hypothetical protein U0797_20180 [Gemmataceae bacterium]
MAARVSDDPVLLRWTKQVPVAKLRDPLGVTLRVAGRLAGQLLFGITSLTKRARYYSFLPWCVRDYQAREKGHPHACNLEYALRAREMALTMGCLLHHAGEECVGGGLNGSLRGKRWYEHRGPGPADLTNRVIDRAIGFVKVPAWHIYSASLMGLGLFNMEASDTDERVTTRAPDDLELSPLGEQLAQCYGSMVDTLPGVVAASGQARRCTHDDLCEWGRNGGICELRDPGAADRDLLRDLFFDRCNSPGKSHLFRRQTLLLILELARQLEQAGLPLNKETFADAVYCDRIVYGDQDVPIRWPSSLEEIARRWRMFYFHYYLSVALESLFVWAVRGVREADRAGVQVDDLVRQLDSLEVRTQLEEFLHVGLPRSFLEFSPRETMAACFIDVAAVTPEVSQEFDQLANPSTKLAERALEAAVRDPALRDGPAGPAVALVLLAVSLMRYARWEGSAYGNWLSRAVNDQYADAAPPVLLGTLHRTFGDWWNRSWGELARFIVRRFVVQLHETVALKKRWDGSRAVFHSDHGRLFWRGLGYDEIKVGNPRFGNALRILQDLTLLTTPTDNTEVVTLTADGRAWLELELAQESAHGTH